VSASFLLLRVFGTERLFFLWHAPSRKEAAELLLCCPCFGFNPHSSMRNDFTSILSSGKSAIVCMQGKQAKARPDPLTKGIEDAATLIRGKGEKKSEEGT